MHGKAQVGLMWVIFFALLMLIVGYLAYDSYGRIEVEKEKRDELLIKNSEQQKRLEYLTLLLHCNSAVLPECATTGALRNPGAADIAAFVESLDGATKRLQQENRGVAVIMQKMRAATTKMMEEYERTASMGSGDLEEEGSRKGWMARDEMDDYSALDTFSFSPPVLKESDMLTPEELGNMDATAKANAEVTDFAKSYLTALVRSIQIATQRKYDELQNLQNAAFHPSTGRMAKLRQDSSEYVAVFKGDGGAASGLLKETENLIERDQGTNFADSLETIKNAASSIEEKKKEALESTSAVLAEMDNNWRGAYNARALSAVRREKFEKRRDIIREHLAEVVDPATRIPTIDGQVIQVAPLRDEVYIDLDAAKHIDLGLRFDVYWVPPVDRARKDLDSNRKLVGSVQVSYVGPKGSTSKAKIVRRNDTDWNLWRGAFLVNREFNPEYQPRVALVGSFKGLLTRESLADQLREHNYRVQAEPDYDTDFVIRGDGGVDTEPVIDGIAISEFGIRSVPMRRMLRMLGMPMQ